MPPAPNRSLSVTASKIPSLGPFRNKNMARRQQANEAENYQQSKEEIGEFTTAQNSKTQFLQSHSKTSYLLCAAK